MTLTHFQKHKTVQDMNVAMKLGYILVPRFDKYDDDVRTWRVSLTIMDEVRFDRCQVFQHIARQVNKVALCLAAFNLKPPEKNTGLLLARQNFVGIYDKLGPLC